MSGTTNQPHGKYPHVYAIVRFDSDMSGKNAATVMNVIPSKELAEQEAERLSEVNKRRSCDYTVQTTRLVEQP